MRKAVPDRVIRECGVVLFPCEALLLCSCQDLPILDQGCSRIMIEGRNAENLHVAISCANVRASKQGVDERSDCRPLDKYQQAPENSHDDQYRNQPVLLARPQI